jgi:putative tryptophan/tyrosine transport system substrate-binding protein
MPIDIGRRKFITLLGGTMVTWPLAAQAQQAGAVRRVGVLMNNKPTDSLSQSYYTELTQTLQKPGWRDGQNLRVDLRWSAGDPQLIHYYAGELVAMTPDLIVASSSANLIAVLRASQTIPIVFLQVSDPVAQGFVPNLAHPGGNITGLTAYELAMGGKWLDLLKQMVPALGRVGVVFNPDTSPQSKIFLRSIESSASSFGVTVTAAPVHDEREIEQAIKGLTGEPNGGLLFSTDTFLNVRRKLIVETSAHYRVPAIYGEEAYVREGGLMYYGVAFENQFRQAAIYVDRILKGAKPGDLPIEMPNTFKLVINLTTAQALGMEVPMGLMMRADELIE